MKPHLPKPAQRLGVLRINVIHNPYSRHHIYCCVSLVKEKTKN